VRAVLQHFAPEKRPGDGVGRGVVPPRWVTWELGRAPLRVPKEGLAGPNTVHFDNKPLTTSIIKREALFASCREFQRASNGPLQRSSSAKTWSLR
jgi:hypothetical protein